ncbi:MAG: flagellar biosynthesis protein FlhF [Planctomycetes bacterium]|nr:flagellar biosynthesis protein FlhF [Planctomycetota bacterium]
MSRNTTDPDMAMKTYRGRSMSDALARVKTDLGRDAVILHTRTIRRGGVLGLGAKTFVEITATADARVTTFRRAANAPATVDNSDNRTTLRGIPVEKPPAPLASSRPAPADPAIVNEIRELRAMVSGLVAKTPKPRPKVPAELVDHYTKLLQQHVGEELARALCERVGKEMKSLAADAKAPDRVTITRELVDSELQRCIETMVPPTPEIALTEQGRPTVIALVGPTGVGKTTTLAKLAANYKLREGRSVGLITIDTYRIAAVEQLRTYADILKIPLVPVTTPDEIAEAVANLKDCDVILIDTAGRSQRDDLRVADLSRFLDAAKPHQVHLVLSSTSREEIIREAAAKFGPLGVKHVIFTKLDEAVGFGVILNVLADIGLHVSYLTNGQSVPDDIEAGSASRVARLILGLPVAQSEAGA